MLEKVVLILVDLFSPQDSPEVLFPLHRCKLQPLYVNKYQCHSQNHMRFFQLALQHKPHQQHFAASNRHALCDVGSGVDGVEMQALVDGCAPIRRKEHSLEHAPAGTIGATRGGLEALRSGHGVVRRTLV